jgi:hypothetical protein
MHYIRVDHAVCEGEKILFSEERALSFLERFLKILDLGERMTHRKNQRSRFERNGWWR